MIDLADNDHDCEDLDGGILASGVSDCIGSSATVRFVVMDERG